MSRFQSIAKDAVELRHHLHQNPEHTWQEVETAKLIRQRLDDLEIPWKACAKTGTLAYLAKNATGPNIGLRCDIDALPLTENPALPHASNNPGCMHACGHDGHTAVLWGMATWLKEQESKLSNPVTLVFQPAEEAGHGAREMIKDGALENIDVIYGWHNWPGIPRGKAVCPDGPIMGGNAIFKIELKGKGGHASQPELCRDPILAGSAIALELQSIVSRRVPPQRSAVVSLTSFDGKSGHTIIPETVTLMGSLRFDNLNVREILFDGVLSIATSVAKAHNVEADVQVEPCYGMTINHAEPAQKMRSSLHKVLGDSWQDSEILLPIMGSEDFSYYLEKIPGAFALIGMAEGDHYTFPCHSPHYQFNDAIVPEAMKILAQLVGASPE
jgi:amidohydrolase